MRVELWQSPPALYFERAEARVRELERLR